MSRGAFVRHRNVVHNTLQRQARPHQHPFQGGISANSESGSDSEADLGEQMPPQGSYYTVHPVLDGRTVQNFI